MQGCDRATSPGWATRAHVSMTFRTGRASSSSRFHGLLHGELHRIHACLGEAFEGCEDLLVRAEAHGHLAERATAKVHLDAMMLEQLPLPLHRERADSVLARLRFDSAGGARPGVGEDGDGVIRCEHGGGLACELENLLARDLALVLQLSRGRKAALGDRHVGRLARIDGLGLHGFLHGQLARLGEALESCHDLFVRAEAHGHLAERATAKVHLDAMMLEQLPLPLHRERARLLLILRLHHQMDRLLGREHRRGLARELEDLLARELPFTLQRIGGREAAPIGCHLVGFRHLEASVRHRGAHRQP
mmetsp:Transcript_16005/g.41219  ORF Transcript_16005/g.41219 Transcript_16005/m.41219 type:complete len:305 (+) Transcript_16005:160-1074(+)